MPFSVTLLNLKPIIGSNLFMASAPSPSPSPNIISLEAYLALETECKQMKAACAFFELQCEVLKGDIKVIKTNAMIEADNANIGVSSKCR